MTTTKTNQKYLCDVWDSHLWRPILELRFLCHSKTTNIVMNYMKRFSHLSINHSFNDHFSVRNNLSIVLAMNFVFSSLAFFLPELRQSLPPHDSIVESPIHSPFHISVTISENANNSWQATRGANFCVGVVFFSSVLVVVSYHRGSKLAACICAEFPFRLIRTGVDWNQKTTSTCFGRNPSVPNFLFQKLFAWVAYRSIPSSGNSSYYCSWEYRFHFGDYVVALNASAI